MNGHNEEVAALARQHDALMAVSAQFQKAAEGTGEVDLAAAAAAIASAALGEGTERNAQKALADVVEQAKAVSDAALRAKVFLAARDDVNRRAVGVLAQMTAAQERAAAERKAYLKRTGAKVTAEIEALGLEMLLKLAEVHAIADELVPLCPHSQGNIVANDSYLRPLHVGVPHVRGIDVVEHHVTDDLIEDARRRLGLGA